MGLILLFAGGAICGWLAAIATAARSPEAYSLAIGIGVLAATLVGVLVHQGTLADGVSATALAVALAAAFLKAAVALLLRRNSLG